MASVSPASSARWLAELRAHPTRHGLLAAFDLLERAARQDRLSERTGHPNPPGSDPHADSPRYLPESTGGPTGPADDTHDLSSHLSESTHRPGSHHHEASRETSGPHHAPRTHLSERSADHEPAPVRFTHSADLSLPLGELLAVDVDPDDPTRHLLTTAGAGPLGPDSPLPLALADALDTAPAHAVLDLFHHRRTLLLCRGLLAADLPATLTGDDAWSRRVVALVGLAGLTRLDTRCGVTALRLAPIFAAPDRSARALAVALRRLLPDLLGPVTTVRCEPIAGHMAPLAADLQSRLGRPAARLGDTAALGVAVRLPGSAVRLTLGPLPAAAVTALRPGGPAHDRLRAVLLAFIPEPLELELVLVLADLCLPPARLGARVLARDLWLATDDPDRPPRRISVPLTLSRE